MVDSEQEWLQKCFQVEMSMGREQVYSQMRNAFKPDGAFKGTVYFDDVEDLITEIKARLTQKEKNDKA